MTDKDKKSFVNFALSSSPKMNFLFLKGNSIEPIFSLWINNNKNDKKMISLNNKKGPTTLSTMTFGITTLGTMIVKKVTLCVMTLSITELVVLEKKTLKNNWLAIFVKPLQIKNKLAN
jgi:hypothetical protein